MIRIHLLSIRIAQEQIIHQIWILSQDLRKFTSLAVVMLPLATLTLSQLA